MAVTGAVAGAAAAAPPAAPLGAVAGVAARAARGSIETASPAPAHCMKRLRVIHGLWFTIPPIRQGLSILEKLLRPTSAPTSDCTPAQTTFVVIVRRRRP
jgi:hypothetical protein